MVDIAEELAKKMKLEETFKHEIRRFLKEVNQGVKMGWIANGDLIDIKNYQIDLIALLKKHYRRVAKAFKRNLRNETKSLILETKQEDQIDDSIRLYIEQHSIEQSIYIMDTTTDQIDNVSALVVAGFLLSGVTPSNLTVANAIKEGLDDRVEGRVDLIAQTETQTVSESIKLTEATLLNDVASVETVKTWNTVLDEKARISHARADNQTRNINDPFVVGGELLKVPSDTSLGASLENIINCRCSSTYNLK